MITELGKITPTRNTKPSGSKTYLSVWVDDGKRFVPLMLTQKEYKPIVDRAETNIMLMPKLKAPFPKRPSILKRIFSWSE